MKDLVVKFFNGLDNSTKKNIYLFIIFSFIVALLEMAGVGLIYPFASFIFSDDKTLFNSSPFLGILKIGNSSYLTVVLLFLLVIFFVIKNILLIYINYLLFKFLANVRHNISCAIFKKYISADYDFYLNKNSGEITRNLTTIINDLNSKIIAPAGLFFSEIMILFFTSLIILIINFKASLSLILFFIIPFFIYYKFIKQKLVNYGNIAQDFESLRIDKINQMIGGIKEIKVHNKERYFTNTYNSYDFKVTRSNQVISTLTQVNKYLLELVLIFSFAFLILYYFIFESDFNISKIMPLLSVYVMAAFKIMPSLNRINNSIQTLRWGDSVLNITSKILSKKNNDKKNRLAQKYSFNSHIRFNKIFFKYKKNKVPVFENLNLTIKKGEMIGITGKSGSGKTTLLNIILGLLYPSAGKIFIDGKNINKNSLHRYKNLIGFVPQDVFLTDSSILSNVAFGVPLKDINIDRVNNCLQLSQIYNHVKSLKDGVFSKVGDRGVRLSGGQKQRLAIARSLYHGAEILVFDEATSALDYRTEHEIMKTINNLDKKYTVIIVAHRVNTLSSCDKIYEVINKKIQPFSS